MHTSHGQQSGLETLFLADADAASAAAAASKRDSHRGRRNAASRR